MSEPVPFDGPERRRTSFVDPGEIDAFVEMLNRFERGEISADAWRSFRVARGAYGQRQDGVHMLRVKIPQGLLLASQLRALAEVAERWSRGFGHITTRQNLQLHFVRPRDLEPAMRLLAGAGITTRESGGNVVRNIVACPHAGVAVDELFEVTPYAEATTRHLLRHPLGSSLPRKFKIAFEGCGEDHVATPVNDLGFRARVRREGGQDRRGFAVTAAGGTSTACTSGWLLEEFLPAAELLELAEAVVRVFHRLGDREHKNRNRMKFLVRDLGWERFRAEIDGERKRVRAEGGLRLPFDPEKPLIEGPPSAARPEPPSPEEIAARVAEAPLHGPGPLPEVRPVLDHTERDFSSWAWTNVRRQSQSGFVEAAVTVPLGEITAGQLRVLADLALAYGDGAVRLTPWQDVLIRWVRPESLQALHRRLAAAGLGRAGAGTISDVVTCPGSEVCQTGVTRSRDLARLLQEHLRSRPELEAAAADLAVRVSGCPDGCSLHHLAGIGFQGSARKLGGRAIPQYFVLIGGGVADGRARFARLVAKIPARRAAEALERLIGLYRDERAEGETATAFFARVDLRQARAALAGLNELGLEEARPEDFVDVGDDEEFRPDVGEGECAA